MIRRPTLSAESRIIHPGLHHNPEVPPPSAFGLPDQFSEWRPGQWDGVQRTIDSPKRFVVVCMPTGMGKSLFAVATAHISGLRSVIGMSTKGLQDQYGITFSDFVHDVRGMANYRCPIAPTFGLSANTTVNEAPCQCGYRCPLRYGGCEYFDRYRLAKTAPIVTTNFACFQFDTVKDPRDAMHLAPWQITPDMDPESVPKAEMLFADEAHSVADEVARFVGVRLSERECRQLDLVWPAQHCETIEDWNEWATVEWRTVKQRIMEHEQKLKADKSETGRGWSRELRLLRDISRKLERLSELQSSDQWIVSRSGTDMYDPDQESVPGSVEFMPLEPARYVERSLWRGIKKIVLMSATVRPKTATMLGIKPEEMDFIEYPSLFDKERRPVIVVPTVMLNWNTEKDDHVMLKWLHRIDSIVGSRLDRKGIIHCVSYNRMKFIKDNSEFGQYILIHGRESRAQIIAEFKRRQPPCILVSPSVGTGYDFPADQARYVIIAKIPFQSMTDPVVKARQARDPEYSTFLTALEIVQQAGRGVRSEDDWAETIVVDDAFGNWFYWRAKKFFPEWFQESIVWAESVPVPMHMEPKPYPDPSAGGDIDLDMFIEAYGK